MFRTAATSGLRRDYAILFYKLIFINEHLIILINRLRCLTNFIDIGKTELTSMINQHVTWSIERQVE